MNSPVERNPSPRFAEVVLNLPADLLLTYSVPPELSGRLKVGQKVLVPLGGRRAGGFVSRFPAPPPARPPRPLAGILDTEPLFGENLVALISWVARYYFCSFARAFKTALPAPVRKNRRAAPILQVELSRAADDVRESVHSLAKPAPRQAALLECLLKEADGPIPVAELLRRAGSSRGSLTALEKKGLVSVTEAERYPAGRGEILPTEPLNLTGEQQAAFRAVREAIDREDFRVFLLHGITGSGKTEIYMQAISEVLSRGRTALVLVPEISLTPQTGDWFRGRFGDQVAIVHSGQSEGERATNWRRIASGEARIVLGPRSAVFAPLADPGLIIVDEEHETSYKQSALAPFYHARDTAVMRGKLARCPVVLGTATPSVESYYNQAEGKYTLLTLRTRPEEAELPEVKIIDIGAERDRQKSDVSFSDYLLAAVKDNLDAGLQTILFLNRRGFFTILTCPECGYIARCRHCSVSLTYHKKTGRQVCHLCGYSEPPPRVCPVCRSRKLVFAGRGTQRIEEQISKIFPTARVRRMDTDTVGKRDAHREILGDFRSGKIDILIGTQMIAKGLDFPNVTLVGVIMADTALNLADFRATEYTYQILTQVAGRAGRGELKGKVVIQTYNAQHPALRAAVRQDYEDFFAKEMRSRRELGYPPVNHFVTLTVLSRNEEKSLKVAEHLARKLEPELEEGAELLGPTPPPIARLRGRYRQQILVKTRGVVATIRALRKVFPEGRWDRDLKVEVDVDPISML